jgi:hypothetical protein
MENNTAILNAKQKVITFKFKDQMFAVDLKEGDLGDNWNSVRLKSLVFDVNLVWEEDFEPSMALYHTYRSGYSLITKHEDFISFALTVIGTQKNYFKL